MKMFKKFSTVALIAVFAVVFVFGFGLAGPNVARAATSPDLGMAASFSILAGTAVTNVPTSDITGNVGLSPAAGSYYDSGVTAAQVTGTIYAVDATGPAGSVVNPASLTQAKNDLITAYDDLSAGANADANCLLNNGIGGTGILSSGTDLATFGNTPGTLPSGLYCSAGTFLLTNARDGSDLILTGAGPWVFRTVSGLDTSTGSSVTVATGSVCDVWWGVGSSATLGTTTSFVGNILALTSISMDTGATLDGRALARNGAVTLESNTINNICSAGATLHATLRVVKDVENDDGDDQNADDFTLYVKSSGTNVAGSPALGVASPGKTYLLAPGTYVVSEDEDGAYNQSFSGDCNSSGSITLAAGQTKTCTITNDDKKDTDKSAEHEKAAPKLPAAGIGPQENNTPWNIVIPVGILMLVSTSLVIVKRKRAI